MTVNIVVLLTACINPGGMIFTKLQNPQERKKQYIESLDWYLQNTNLRIVFVENSNNDLSSMYKQYISDNRLEMLCFDGNSFDKTLGKGYGEALIIDYALKNSVLLRNAQMIVKITGRLKCINIESLVSSFANPHTVYSVCRREKDGRMVMDSRLFICPPSFFINYFLRRKELLNDTAKYYFEHLLYDSCQRWGKDGFCFREFYKMPHIIGTGGTGEIDYSVSPIKQIYFYMRYFLHRIGYYGPLRFWE